MSAEPEMCPCGCGLEREAAIKSSMDFLGWDRERAERAMDSFKVDK